MTTKDLLEQYAAGKRDFQSADLHQNWDPNPLVECAGGIHFFLTREEAEDYDG